MRLFEFISIKGMAFVALTTLLFSCSETANTETQTAEANTQIEMDIEGMTCEVGCKKVIEKNLRATGGIASFDIDFETKKAMVSFDQQHIDTTAIREAVESVNNGAYQARINHTSYQKL